MPIEKVTPGQVMRGFPAKTYNRLADIINAFDDGKLTLNRQFFDVIKSACVVEVENNSGGSRSRLDVLGVDGPIILPSTDEEEFKNKLRVTGITPGDDHVPHNFVILLEPIDSGKIGYGVIAGASVAKINVSEESHEWAGCETGLTTSLASRQSGGARILWKEEGTGLKFGIVRFSGGASDIEIVKVDGAGCTNIHDDSFCLWSGKVQTLDIGAATMCDPWSNGQDCWIMIAGGCPNPNEGKKIKAGARYMGHLRGTYRDRPLFTVEFPGVVAVDEQDNPDYLWEQIADQIVSTGTQADVSVTSNTPDDGSILCAVQIVTDSLDRKLRWFEYVSNYNESNEQALTHPQGSSTKSWTDIEEVEVITDLRVVGTTIEKRTSTIKVLSNTDNGWSTALTGTDCT